MDQPPPPESPPPIDGPPDQNARNWAMGCHLAGFAGLIFSVTLAHIIAPLVVWLIKRHDHPYIDEQGKESLNFQITVTIYALIAGLLIFVLVGIVLLPMVIIFAFIMVIIASIKTSNGEPWRYPLTIRFVK